MQIKHLISLASLFAIIGLFLMGSHLIFQSTETLEQNFSITSIIYVIIFICLSGLGEFLYKRYQ